MKNRLIVAVMLIAIIVAISIYSLRVSFADKEELPTETIKDDIHVAQEAEVAEDVPVEVPKETPPVIDAKPTPPLVEKKAEPVQVEVEATFYTARCNGCIGITKSGHNVKNTIYVDGYRVIAVDPTVIPLGSIVQVKLEDGEQFKAIASDTGGAIKRNRIDVLVKDNATAYRKGRQSAVVTILK